MRLSTVIGEEDMTDVYDQTQRSKVMRSVKSENTKPEVIVRQTLHALGYRFRLHRRDLPGKPDIVLPRYHKIIFVHGCFWHQHPNCKDAERPQSNTDYWNRKLDRNVQRDQNNITVLRASSWSVLVIWTCETKNRDQLRQRLEAFMRDRYEPMAE
jgi:DNA mismatch endonuclease (patch repair protein)